MGADEQGVVLRFGKFVARTGPGINYHLPWPIETVQTPKVTRENQIDIGYRQTDEGSSDEIPYESLMLTGDENIVDINFTVYWLINNAADFLFNVQNPDGNPNATIKAVAESAMREVVGQNQIEPILTQDREPIQVQVKQTHADDARFLWRRRHHHPGADAEGRSARPGDRGLSRRAGRPRRPGAACATKARPMPTR